jgi:hypothetical protein
LAGVNFGFKVMVSAVTAMPLCKPEDFVDLALIEFDAAALADAELNQAVIDLTLTGESDGRVPLRI